MVKPELQSPAPWINSRHHIGVKPPKSKPDTAEDDWLLDEVARLSDQANTALTVAMVTTSLLILAVLVGFIMWAGGLLLIMH